MTNPMPRGVTFYAMTAVAAATALGAVESLGQLLYRSKPWWAIMTEQTVPLAAQWLFLMAAIAFALKVQVDGVPRWLLLGAATVLATAAAAAADLGASYFIRGLMGVEDDFRPDYVARWWTSSASLLVVGALTALCVGSAADAMKRTSTLRALQLEHARLARRGFESRLAALQARVNPQFLFDTLSDVELLYDRDAITGQRALDELIVYLRAALASTRVASSTVGAELHLVRAWTEIVRLRSQGRFEYMLPPVDALAAARLPPMILLPLVQQAVEAGERDRRFVFVSVERRADRLLLSVIGPTSAFGTGNSPAVEAVVERTRVLYGDGARLALEPAQHNRSRALLDVPYEPAGHGRDGVTRKEIGVDPTDGTRR